MVLALLADTVRAAGAARDSLPTAAESWLEVVAIAPMLAPGGSTPPGRRCRHERIVAERVSTGSALYVITARA